MLALNLLLAFLTARADDPAPAAPPTPAPAAPPEVDWKTLALMTQSTPERPESAKDAALPEKCLIGATLDAEGVVTATDISDCPDPFGEAAKAAVMAWRFKAPKVDGVAMPVHTVVEVSFGAKKAKTAEPTCNVAVTVVKGGKFEAGTGTEACPMTVPSKLMYAKYLTDEALAAPACAVVFTVDGGGFTKNLELDACPEPLQAAAKEIVSRTIWKNNTVYGLSIQFSME